MMLFKERYRRSELDTVDVGDKSNLNVPSNYQAIA